MTKPAPVALVTGALLALAVGASLPLLSPPAPAPGTASPGEFSATRAMTHVRAIARAPHPIGSEEHARVRDYVVRALEDVGAEVSVQRTIGVTTKYRALGSVENVVARLPGTAPRRGALLLAAHYDSVAAGPGAGDDACGVAAILEAVRAARTGPPLHNDVVVLVSDGEESGLLGASAFMAEHPLAESVKVAVNLDARGNAGQVSLFETSSGNAWIVGEAARAAPQLVGSSLSYEAYKHMPNDTDATVFKASGLATLNFAFVGHWEAYHTPGDDPEHLDQGTLQQEGEYTLGLLRTLGDADLDAAAAPSQDEVFFTLPGRVFVHYARNIGVALAALAALLFVAMARHSVSSGRATAPGVLAGFGVFLLEIALLAAIGYGLAARAGALHGAVLGEGNVVESAPYAAAVAVVAAAVWLTVHVVVRTRLSAEDVAAGALAALAAFACVASVAVSGVGYVLTWPALGAGALLALGGEPHDETTLVRATRVALALPAIAVVVPLIHAVFESLGVTPAGAALMAVLVGVLAGAIALPLDALVAAPAARRVVAILAAAVGGALFVAGMILTRTSTAHPKASRLWYVLDETTAKARWASSSAHDDSWTAAFIGEHPASAPLFPGWAQTWLQGDADVLDLPPPEVTVVDSSADGAERTLRLLVRPGRDGTLELETSRDVLEATVDGKRVAPSVAGQLWSMTYANVSHAGITLVLRVRGAGAVRLDVTERWPGLPHVAGKPARPSWSVSRHDGDQTAVRRRVEL